MKLLLSSRSYEFCHLTAINLATSWRQRLP